MTIGERIKQARKEKGLTQKRLGELSGTSEGTVRQYEIGKRQPRLEQLQAIAKALDVPVAHLLIGPPPLEEDAIDAENFPESGLYSLAQHRRPPVVKIRIMNAVNQMTREGQWRVADYAEDILPRYKAGKTPPEATGAPPTPTEGK